MKPAEKILDVAFQKLSHNKLCFNCNRKATAIHHLIRRSDKLNRWNKLNSLPVCFDCHFKIHNGVLREPKLYIERDNIKDYLLRNAMTYDEFLQAKMKEFGICQLRLSTINTIRTKKPTAKKSSVVQNRLFRKTEMYKKSQENRRKKWKDDYRKMQEWKKNKKRGIS